jgi:hypothetical protein
MIQATSVVEDLAVSARNMVDVAIAVTTGRMHLDDPSDARTMVFGNDAAALQYFRHELAHQVAMLLMRLDSSVVDVSLEHELPEAEEFGTPNLDIADPIRLIVQADRNSAALRSLISAIDTSLVDVLCAECGRIAPGLINVEIIDQAQARRFSSRAGGFRPPPTILVTRTSRGTGHSDETQAL